jgi:hypothetical protein
MLRDALRMLLSMLCNALRCYRKHRVSWHRASDGCSAGAAAAAAAVVTMLAVVLMVLMVLLVVVLVAG